MIASYHIISYHITSYRISKHIATCGKSHNNGETLLIPAIEELVTTVIHHDPTNDLTMFPLSDTTVSRRIDDMADDIYGWVS